MPSGDLGRVRLVTADSTRMSLKNAFLIDSSVVGAMGGNSVKIPVDKISRIERHEADGFLIFLVVNVTSVVFFKQGLSLFVHIAKL